jgi:hypothetical protein
MDNMAYTWQEIEQDWLSDAALDISPDEAVTAFCCIESVFGRAWIEATRTRNGSVSQGAAPTLHIITLGLMLQALDGLPNKDGLLQRLRDNRQGAWAELCAIYLLRFENQDVLVEIEPEVVVGRRNRKPDFRTRLKEAEWAYVEVTQASRNSAAQKGILGSLNRLTGLVESCAGSYALEVFLKREPSAKEVDYIEEKIKENYRSPGPSEAELPSGLGTLYWNQYPPGAMILDDHGEPYTPRLSSAKAAGLIGGEHQGIADHRHIVVRWPFTDMRAEDMLNAEAKQLPTDAPGMVMIQTSGAVGAMKAWRGLMQRRFQPTIHTRVGAVCLFTSLVNSAESGAKWQPECKLILNPYARRPLPGWIVDQLEQFPSREIDI